jgi:hypothetical protein
VDGAEAMSENHYSKTGLSVRVEAWSQGPEFGLMTDGASVTRTGYYASRNSRAEPSQRDPSSGGPPGPGSPTGPPIAPLPPPNSPANAEPYVRTKTLGVPGVDEPRLSAIAVGASSPPRPALTGDPRAMAHFDSNDERTPQHSKSLDSKNSPSTSQSQIRRNAEEATKKEIFGAKAEGETVEMDTTDPSSDDGRPMEVEEQVPTDMWFNQRSVLPPQSKSLSCSMLHARPSLYYMLHAHPASPLFPCTPFALSLILSATITVCLIPILTLLMLLTLLILLTLLTLLTRPGG